MPAQQARFRSGRTHLSLPASIVLCALVLLGCERRDLPTVDRELDPVVLTGADVPGLLGLSPDRVVAFRFVYGTWVQLPVQVDERALVDFGTIKHMSRTGTEALQYSDSATWTGPDADPTVDVDDEIVFMARDAFGQAHDIDDGTTTYTLSAPPHVVAGSGVEVEIADPRGDDERSWVYLFESDGTLASDAGTEYVDYEFDLLSGDYKSTYRIGGGGNPEASEVTTPAYSSHFPDRWIMDEIRVRRNGATGADILDQHKTGFAGSSARTEATFSAGSGAFIANKSGPVRAIRSYLGANSGTYTQRTHLMYESRHVIITDLRVHAIPAVREWFDYSPSARGMRYTNSALTRRFRINAIPDAVPTAQATWELVSGAQGSLVVVPTLETSIEFPADSRVQYYSDTATPSETQCTGDAFEYGASGPWIAQSVPCTDPTLGCTETLRHTRAISYLGPSAAVGAAREIAADGASPLTVTVEHFEP